jgi:Aspartyl protease
MPPTGLPKPADPGRAPGVTRATRRVGGGGAALVVLLAVAGVAHGRAAPRAQVARASCAATRVARVPLRDDGGYLSVPVSIRGPGGGGAFSLLVDTGAEGGLIQGGVVSALHLPIDPDRRTVLHGTGGIAGVVPNAIVPDLRLGTAGPDQEELDLGMVSMPVGDLPGQPVIQPPVAGLLGGDVLAGLDVEFDVAGGWLSFWRVRSDAASCHDAPDGGGAEGGVPAWHGVYETIPLLRAGHRVSVAAELDGMPLTALVDSGARSRILSTDMAARAGLSADRLAGDPGGETSGVDGRRVLYHWHAFTSLRIGRWVERAPVLTVAPLPDGLDMLLGADWFARHDVWISYATGRMFVRPAR